MESSRASTGTEGHCGEDHRALSRTSRHSERHHFSTGQNRVQYPLSHEAGDRNLFFGIAHRGGERKDADRLMQYSASITGDAPK